MEINEAANVLRVYSAAKRTRWDGSQLLRAIDAAVAALEAVDTITQRARELIGLHLSEQEGMVIPTAKQFQDAIDALAKAIGAADQQPNQHQADCAKCKEKTNDA